MRLQFGTLHISSIESKMVSWSVFGLLVLAALGAANAGRIVGGQPTTIHEYPSIVQVEFLGTYSSTWSQSCAASILNTRHVLSAAHCFRGFFYTPSTRRIRAGSAIRNTGGQIVYVERENNHPSYLSNGSDGDISVIRLTYALIYNPAIQPGPIVPQDYSPPDNVPVEHAGWGTTTQGGVSSNQLQDVTIYTVNNQLCKERYHELDPVYIVTENMVCAGILDVGGKDACQGDSGGPLYLSGILVGVVSWGYGCAHPTYPGVSTAVGPYTNWIRSIAEQ